MRVPVLFVIYESNKQWKKQINNLIRDPWYFLFGFWFLVCHGFWVLVVFLCFVLFFFLTKTSISWYFVCAGFLSHSVEQQLVIKTKNV